jgi:MinD-like ATPase involved in chromosome partitioning or flagellar assembly
MTDDPTPPQGDLTDPLFAQNTERPTQPSFAALPTPDPVLDSTPRHANGALHPTLAAPPPAPAPVDDPHPHLDTDWSYVTHHAAEPLKQAPAEWGWRARIREISAGMVALAPGPDELTNRAAISQIQATLPGSRTIVVANEKGGAGKTPTALILSALLAEYRREAVVVWDVNELRGTLGRRAEIAEPSTTITDVLAAAHDLARPEAEVGLLSSFLRRQPEGNLVLASSEDGNAMRQIGHEECDIIRQLLLRRFGIVVCDTGNNAAASNFLYTVDSSDVLVIPTAPSSVHLEVARAMLRMLASRETTKHLVSAAVLVVTSPTGARLAPAEEQWFSERIGQVVHVPADSAIAEGGKLAISDLSVQSRRGWTQVAGAVINAATAPSPRDKPRGRRRAPEPPADDADSITRYGLM